MQEARGTSRVLLTCRAMLGGGMFIQIRRLRPHPDPDKIRKSDNDDKGPSACERQLRGMSS